MRLVQRGLEAQDLWPTQVTLDQSGREALRREAEAAGFRDGAD